MRALLRSDARAPVGGDVVDPADVYTAVERVPPHGRPWVLLNMVASVDGATAIEGASGPLGGPADRQVFSIIRSVADVILAGAGTVRAEGYGPPRTPQPRQQERRARGQAPRPRMAVLSGRLDLDPRLPLFTEVDERTIVLTVENADATRRAALDQVAEVVSVGADRTDPVAVMAALAARASVVLVEGGPTLNGQLLTADLVDELCLTVAPLIAGGVSARIAAGATAGRLALELSDVLEEDHTLFLHYLRRR